MSFERASQQTFFGTSALLFMASTALMAGWFGSRSGMGGMTMPGGWRMSMTWMRMPGETWPGVAASFLGMWMVMMVAMMMPSLVPMLWRYYRTVDSASEARLGSLAALVGLGYFFVWAVCGMGVYPLGVLLILLEMQLPALARTAPLAVGMVVVIAGVLQFTGWKARHLACCREEPDRGGRLPAGAGAVLRQGLRFGLHCGLSCANLTATLLVIGVMDLRAMVLVTEGVTAECLAPGGERVARGIGVSAIGIGFFLIARAVGLG